MVFVWLTDAANGLSFGRLASRLGVVAGATLIAFVIVVQVQPVHAFGRPAASGAGMTIYAVTNPNSTTINVEHVFSNSSGFQYTFWSPVPPNTTTTYRVATMPQIPAPFNGTVTLYADAPFTARVTGYDNLNPPPAGQYRVFLPQVSNPR